MRTSSLGFDCYASITELLRRNGCMATLLSVVDAPRAGYAADRGRELDRRARCRAINSTMPQSRALPMAIAGCAIVLRKVGSMEIPVSQRPSGSHRLIKPFSKSLSIALCRSSRFSANALGTGVSVMVHPVSAGNSGSLAARG